MGTAEELRRREALDARMRGFHGVGVDDVLAVLDYLREPGDTVIAGGSLTFGLGNRLSDFDVVLCGATTSRSLVPLQHWVSTLRVDAWTRSYADIDALFVLAGQALAGSAPLAGAFGSIEQEQQLKLLHRIAFGLQLAGPALAPASAPDFRAVARDMVVREYAERLRESILVAQVAARSRRWLTAVANAREAVEEAFTIVLTARGVPFTGDKWLHERLKSHAPDLREVYRRYASLPAATDEGAADECAAYVADAVALAARLTGLPVAVEELAAGVTWIATGLRVCPVGPVRLLVSPGVGGAWELSGVDLAAWESLTRGSESDRLSWRGDGPAEVGFCLALYERGLVELSWDRGVPVSELTVAATAGVGVR